MLTCLNQGPAHCLARVNRNPLAPPGDPVAPGRQQRRLGPADRRARTGRSRKRSTNLHDLCYLPLPQPVPTPMSPPPIGLLGLGAYAPERVMTNDEWAKYVDTTDEWITERTGIKRRHVAAPDQTTVDLAEQAARRALADAGLEP